MYDTREEREAPMPIRTLIVAAVIAHRVQNGLFGRYESRCGDYSIEFSNMSMNSCTWQEGRNIYDGKIKKNPSTQGQRSKRGSRTFTVKLVKEGVDFDTTLDIKEEGKELIVTGDGHSNLRLFHDG